MANEVTLGYSPSKGQYHVEEIRGNWPVAHYQQFTVKDNPTLPDQVEHITFHVGDWLTEGEAEKLAEMTHLIVRPYRAEEE